MSTTSSNNNQRWTVNLISLVVTLSVLLVAVQVSSGSFAVRISKISENLDRQLADLMGEGSPVFTNLTDNSTYQSKTGFNPRGMAGLYNFSSLFMDLVLSKDIYPEGFLKVENNRLQLGSFQEEWKGLLGKYAGLLTMIIVIALIVVFMPLCGFCFCCCRCCGKCGARSQPFDKKHDLCKKIMLATMLICLGTLLLFGVVCAFWSNQQMQEGVDELTNNLRTGLKDVDTYLDSTNDQVDVLLNVNYNEFEDVLSHTLNEANNIVYNELANYSNATSMTVLANIVDKLPDIKEGFDKLKYSTNSLRVYASQLNDAVRKVKKDLLQTLQNCKIPKCQDINKNISSLQTNIHFNSYIDRYFPKLPDITEQIFVLDNLNQDDFTKAVTNGKQKLEAIKDTIGKTVNKTLTDARRQITKAGAEIKKGASNITSVIQDLKKKLVDNTQPSLRIADDYIKQYGPYRYYGALAISCILLFISLCVALGLVCGICGKRPDVYGDDCCNKGAGSQFLVCGVMVMFISGFVIAVVVLATFVLGIVSQRIVCDPIRDPAHSQVFKLVDQLDLSNYYIDFKLSEALTRCYRNRTIYETFNLQNKFDLNKVKNYLDTFNIKDILDGLDMDAVRIPPDFTILDPSDVNKLKQLAASKFADVNFDNFEEVLDDKFTNFNLSELSTELGELIEQIDPSNPNNNGIRTELQLSKMNIDTYQEKIVEPMIKNATAVKELAIKLENDLKLGHQSFEDAIDSMLKELKSAEDELKTNGNELLTNIAKDFTNGIINQIQAYLDRIVDKTSREVGKCGPLSLVINATLTSTCDKILHPWNGFWFGLFWSLILFIPTIFVSVKLATLYQKYSPYSGPLVEAEYLYDAYADRDNIPLNSRDGKSSKKKNKKYQRYDDRPVPSAGGDLPRDFPGGSHQDTRYADMAPKHWEEFPAGGPPQYQRAPTEYERPPPYYYPGGNGESQQ